MQSRNIFCALGLQFRTLFGAFGECWMYKDANTSPDFLYKEDEIEDFCEGGMDASKRIVLGLRSLGIHPISEYPDHPRANIPSDHRHKKNPVRFLVLLGLVVT